MVFPASKVFQVEVGRQATVLVSTVLPRSLSVPWRTMNSFDCTITKVMACVWMAAGLSVTAFGADPPLSGKAGVQSSPGSAEKPVQVLVNHVGFTPKAAKYCVISASSPLSLR